MPRVLVGGVGYRWLRDASFGLVAIDQLATMTWPDTIRIEDLGYGAIYAAQDIGAAAPPYDRLILIAGQERGREPGRLYRYDWLPYDRDPAEVQARMREAGAGVIDLDHLLVIGHYFRHLPSLVSLFEVEPLETHGGEGLSLAATALLPAVIEMVCQEAMTAVAAS